MNTLEINLTNVIFVVKGLIKQENVTVYKWIHTGDKPYKCEVCNKEVSHSGHCTRHMRIHTSDKPYKCEVCQDICPNTRFDPPHKDTHW